MPPPSPAGSRSKRPAHWSAARAALREADPTLAAIIDAVGNRTLERRHDPFVSLARAIVGQQLSTAAAKTIWERVLSEVTVLTPEAILSAERAALRACGLSERKTDYLGTLARGFAEGGVNPAAWQTRDDEAVIEDLTRLPGIGRWTAEMFLIFHLLRPDVLPLGDVGVQRALRLHYGNGAALGPRKLARVTNPWRPWRSVATWYLWRSLELD